MLSLYNIIIHRFFVRLLLFLLCVMSANAATLQPQSLEQFWLEPNQKSTLQFILAPLATKGGFQYEIKNYSGKTSSKGIVQQLDGKLTISIELPSGHYVCRFPALKQQFGISVSMPFVGPKDQFFGIDGALSWLAAGKRKTKRESLVKIMARGGISAVRDRIWWGDLNSASGKYRFEGGRRAYSAIRKLYLQNEIKVLDVFHDTPKWQKTPDSPYPGNLVETSKSWLKIAKHFKNNWCGLELWNEPDIGFGGKLPAEYYIPLVKALSYIYRKNKISTPLVGAVFTNHCPDVFMDVCAKSGLLDCVDAISFHQYGKWQAIPELIKKYRSWLKKYGHPHMPLWITECGYWWKGESSFPSPEDGRKSAMQIVLKTIEAKAYGITRFFPFVYAFYLERGLNFSMFSKNYSPLQPLTAYFTTINFLANKHYVGDLKDKKGNIICRVFKANNGDCVVVASPGKITSRIRLPLPKSKCFGIDGRQLQPDNSGSVNIPDGLIYQTARWKNVKKRLLSKTDAMSSLNVSQIPPSPPAVPPAIILAPIKIETGNIFHVGKEGYTIELNGSDINLKLKVVNLSSVNANVILWMQQNTVIQQSYPVQENINIAPGVAKNINFKIKFKEKPDFTRTYFLKVCGTSDGRKLQPLVIAVNFSAKNFKNAIAGAKYLYRPEFHVPEKWQKRMGKGKLNIAVSPQNTLFISATFPTTSPNWFFPTFKLKKVLPENCRIMLRAKCIGNGGASVRMFALEKDGSMYMSRILFKSDKSDSKWHKIILTDKDFGLYSKYSKDENGQLDFEQINRIQFGANTSKEKSVTLEISDLVFFVK